MTLIYGITLLAIAASARFGLVVLTWPLKVAVTWKGGW